jgi:hypothetical protein
MLCEELKAHFDGDPETIEREALAFIDKLAANRLVLPA